MGIAFREVNSRASAGRDGQIGTSLEALQRILGQRMVYTYRLSGLAAHSACPDRPNRCIMRRNAMLRGVVHVQEQAPPTRTNA